MRIKIEGCIGKERVMQVIEDLLRRADADALTGFNMYFTIRDDRGFPVDLLNENGEPLEFLVYRETRHAVPLRKQRPPRVKKGQKPVLKIVGGTEAKAA